MAIETPCINVCTVDPATSLCVGCGRSLDEIGRWLVMSPQDRRQIMAELPARRARLRGSSTACAEQPR
jgi:uncharacterized protein